MPREYLDSKEIGVGSPSDYKILNLYKVESVIPFGSEMISLWGLFRSDIPANGRDHHWNENHFPILFMDEEKARKFFRKINNMGDVNSFWSSLDSLLG